MMLKRFWIYQRERFPIFAHGALIAAFSFSAVSFSRLLRGQGTLPSAQAAIVAFLTSFLFFLQLRIADEFKDFEEDARYRPYRPVPRGLVTLRELGWLWLAVILLQVALALWLDPTITVLLVGTWIYLLLMTKEFFIRDWLTARPLTYLFSHVMIMPLIDFYATACDWWAVSHRPPQGLFWFVIVSYFNGVVIEVGRKIRPPEAEEEGVNTYSAMWGRPRAVAFWLGFLSLTAIAAAIASALIDFLWPMIVVLSILLLCAGAVGWTFLRRPTPKKGKMIEAVSGLWTIFMYLSLGAAPLLWRSWQESGG